MYGLTDRNSIHQFSASAEAEIEQKIKEYLVSVVRKLFPRAVDKPTFTFYPSNWRLLVNTQKTILGVRVELVLVAQELGVPVSCDFMLEYVITKNR